MLFLKQTADGPSALNEVTVYVAGGWLMAGAGWQSPGLQGHGSQFPLITTTPPIWFPEHKETV